MWNFIFTIYWYKDIYKQLFFVDKENPKIYHFNKKLLYDLLYFIVSSSILGHGNWGEWSGFSKCTASCGGGKQSRSRSCNNPPPSNGGDDCLLSDGSGLRSKEETETLPCNTQKCPGKDFFMFIMRKDINIIICISTY